MRRNFNRSHLQEQIEATILSINIVPRQKRKALIGYCVIDIVC